MDRRDSRRRDLFVGGDGAWVKRITVFFLDAIVPPRAVDGSAHVEEWLEMVEWVSFSVVAVLIIVAAIIASLSLLSSSLPLLSWWLVLVLIALALALVMVMVESIRELDSIFTVGVGESSSSFVVAAVFVAVVVVILDGHVQCTHAVVIVIGGHGVVWL